MTQRTTGNDTTDGRELIDHPLHYNAHPAGIECIEVIAPMDVCLGTAVKHLHRAGLKGGEAKFTEDLNKAINYLGFAIKYLSDRNFVCRGDEDPELIRRYLAGFEHAYIRYALHMILWHSDTVRPRNIQIDEAISYLRQTLKDREI